MQNRKQCCFQIRHTIYIHACRLLMSSTAKIEAWQDFLSGVLLWVRRQLRCPRCDNNFDPLRERKNQKQHKNEKGEIDPLIFTVRSTTELTKRKRIGNLLREFLVLFLKFNIVCWSFVLKKLSNCVMKYSKMCLKFVWNIKKKFFHAWKSHLEEMNLKLIKVSSSFCVFLSFLCRIIWIIEEKIQAG